MLRQIRDIVNNTTRPTWDEWFMSQAFLTASRSPSIKKKVGCVIVKNKRVLCSGYNGFPAGAPHESISVDGKEVNTIHAEQNTIADAAKRGINISNSTLYCTYEPCIDCMKMIAASGIKCVKYYENKSEDKYTEAKQSIVLGSSLTVECIEYLTWDRETTLKRFRSSKEKFTGL